MGAQVYTNVYSTNLPSNDDNRFETRYSSDEIRGVKNEKRDVIKGPSLFSKIDASTADSDLAFENEEITGHSDLSRFYDKPNDIEDKLDDMDRWVAPNSHHLSGQLHVHRKKSFVYNNHFPKNHDQRASKKSTFPRQRHIRYEDVPDEVIKALYNWQIDDAINRNAAKKSSLGNNSLDLNSESAKPFVTEEELPIEDHTNAKIGRKNTKKRQKINVLVNVKLTNEAPDRRSGVDVPHELGSSLISLSSKTEAPQKRHFPYFYPRHRRHRIHQGLLMKKISEDSGSAEGSGSGISDHHQADEKANDEKVKSGFDGENDESEGSGSGHFPATVQHIQISVSPAAPAASPVGASTPADATVRNDSVAANARNDTTLVPKKDDTAKEDTSPKEVNTQKEVAQKDDSSPKEDPASKEDAPQKEFSATKEETKTQNEGLNDQEGSADQADEKVQEKSNEQSHKMNAENNDKVNTAGSSSTISPSTETADPGTKEEPTDGSENMKKKSGQEDKYETLEEVREKFKKWESKIIHRPSENTVDESDNVSPKSADSDVPETRQENEPEEKSIKKAPEKSDENNSVNSIVNDNGKILKKTDKTSEKEEENKVDEKPEERDDESNKANKANTKSDAATAQKIDESNGVALKQQESVPAINAPISASVDNAAKNVSSEKLDDSSSKRDENDTASAKSDETSTTSKSKVIDELNSSIAKTNDLASGILITEKDSGEDEPQHLIKQKEPDDFVKELIGIPSKKLILKEKEDAKTTSKAEKKGERKSENAKVAPKAEKIKTVEGAEDKFDIEEVNNRNQEHHDIPDSDMKDGAHTLNASDVASFENQMASSDEGPSPEKTTSAVDNQEVSSEDKTLLAEEKTSPQ